MSVRQAPEPAGERHPDHRLARRLEWITLAIMVPTIVVIYLSMGGSQAMKTAWVEDVLSLVPPAAFLIAVRVEDRPPSKDYPYGFHRAVAIAFLCAAVALVAMGAYLLFESVSKLASGEHPTIGTVELLGRQVWHGWVMMAVLAASSIPPVVLGRMKLRVAETLHDKALRVDADMNKADWQTAGAAILGLVGIGYGLWWADAAAAALISLSILRDGATHLGRVVKDLMDMTPTRVGGAELDPLPDEIRAHLEAMEWVEAAEVRLREAGHVLTGEAFVVPTGETGLLARLEEAVRTLERVNPRLYDFSVIPVRTLRRHDGGGGAHGPPDDHSAPTLADAPHPPA
ncbi:MAG TPA: cation diffusion facilitator family transporter [Longimicrobium sp.]